MPDLNLPRLSSRIQSISLFSTLGTRVDADAASQISSWDEWAGPEDPLVMEIGWWQQAQYDAVESELDKEQWDRALRTVVAIAKQVVPYKEDEDAWYAPNTAAWCAAWTFALEEAYVANSIPVPVGLLAQLHWYERGHWPCALISLGSENSVRGYVVY